MNRKQILDYYSRTEVINELVKNSRDREIAGSYYDGRFDIRPNIFQYPSDITQMVNKGVVAFHFSVEHWKNPMQLISENYEENRKGWDFIIDIDSKIRIEEAQLAAIMICSLLEGYGIKNYGIKFSGRRGFHISLSWQMFPKVIDYKPIEKLYPKIPRILARFIRLKIHDDLMKELIKRKGAKDLISILEEPPERLDPFYFIEIEKDWGHRHMFRAPYSLNEKTWLVSLPLQRNELKKFVADDAKPENIKIFDFFGGEENEAESLLSDALDWYAAKKKEKPKVKRIIKWERKISETAFPPCMKLILSGLPDGRKRSIFTLTNFLRMMNWSWSEIEQQLFEWNEKNQTKLPQNILISQFRWNQQNSRTPPNCDNDLFYQGIGICRPDEICKAGTDRITIKNPVVYPFKKMGKEKFREKAEFRGFSCICGRKFKSMKSLHMHKGRVHPETL